MIGRSTMDQIDSEVTQAAAGSGESGEVVGRVDMPVTVEHSVPVVDSSTGISESGEFGNSTGDVEEVRPAASGGTGKEASEDTDTESLTISEVVEEAESGEIIEEDTGSSTTGTEAVEETAASSAGTTTAAYRNNAMATAHAAVEDVKTKILESKRKFGLIKLRDRKEISDVKDAINKLNALIHGPVPGADDEQLYAVQLETICQDYESLIQSLRNLQTYINTKSKPSDQERSMLGMADQIISQSTDELERFRIIKTNYITGILVTGTSWMEALYTMRAVSLDMGNVTNKGGGTSELYKQTLTVNGTTTTSFIKAEERLVDLNMSDLPASILEKYAESGGDETRALVERVLARTDREEIKVDINTLLDRWTGHIDEGLKDDELEEAMVSDAKPKTIEAFGGRDVFRTFLMYAVKKANEYYTGHERGSIATGAVVSDRNVSTSRAANRFGLGNIVAGSEMVMLTRENGSIVRANAMEGVVGEGITEMSKLMEMSKNNNMELTLTGNAAKELFELQIFDLICGQLDRHTGNYMAFYDETPKNEAGEGGRYTVTGIKAIDNDMSFGEMSARRMNAGVGASQTLKVEFDRTGVAKLPDRVSVPFISRQFYDRIMSPLTDDLLTFEQMDIRSKAELDALHDRFRSIQQQVSALVSGGKMLVIEDEDEYERIYNERVLAAFASGKLAGSYVTTVLSQMQQR